MKRTYWIFILFLSLFFLVVSFLPAQAGMECISTYHLEGMEAFTPGVFKVKIETNEPEDYWRLDVPSRFWIVAHRFKKGKPNIESWWVLTFAKPGEYDLRVVQVNPLFSHCSPQIHTVFHLTLLRRGLSP